MAVSKKAILHRTLNSCILMAVATGLWFGSQKIDRYMEESVDQTEISQLLVDEGLRRCVYKDTLGNATVGVGHLVKQGENFNSCIKPQQALAILRDDYNYAKQSVRVRYPWAQGEVQRVLINLTFQLGEHRLAGFKNTLKLLKEERYYDAAGELLDSTLHKQTPSRLERHAARLIALGQEDGL